jgi:hypothetical protein
MDDVSLDSRLASVEASHVDKSEKKKRKRKSLGDRPSNSIGWRPAKDGSDLIERPVN